MKSIIPFKYENGLLKLLDQRKLPLQTVWIELKTYKEVALSIENMAVRGAPAIGCCAAWGYFLGIKSLGSVFSDKIEFEKKRKKIFNRLSSTRPTAVNLFWALEQVSNVMEDDFESYLSSLEKKALEIEEDDRKSCRDIGKHGALSLPQGEISVLTHCNAGALATAGYGTALGVIRTLHENGRLKMAYADDTRPRQQGARLTVWELMEDNIPVTLLADTAAGWLLSSGKIDAVVVGADRIASNGDTANKIGTYMVALAAKMHNIPFFVAAPLSTLDFSISSGDEIEIEVRSPDEVRKVGDIYRTVPTVAVINPAFDVTPSELITGIITENGVAHPPYTDSLKLLRK
jgi:methylthioribose-1-phosphate isomerase